MRFLMAITMQHAITAARTDCEWDQIGKYTFADKNGFETMCITDPERLRGQPDGTIVYVCNEGINGRSCAQRTEWDRKVDMLRYMRLLPAEVPVTERVKEARQAAYEANRKAGYFR